MNHSNLNNTTVTTSTTSTTNIATKTTDTTNPRLQTRPEVHHYYPIPDPARRDPHAKQLRGAIEVTLT